MLQLIIMCMLNIPILNDITFSNWWHFYIGRTISINGAQRLMAQDLRKRE